VSHGGIEELIAIMARLRDPQSGCPWDIEQDFASIAPYTIEEAYEVADAIERGDFDDLREELGDLLLQVVFHARMAEEQGRFDFRDVVRAICDKMVSRHPHVFGDAAVADAAAQTLAWEEHKRREREAKGRSGGLLADIPRGLPEAVRAHKLQKRAASAGFDWPDVSHVMAKLDEELAELREELHAERIDADRLEGELGDVLFVLVNFARHTGIDFSRALRRTNAKFERRFAGIEARAAAAGIEVKDADLDQQTAWYLEARAEESS
jgi:nucleoside triphosphate diphosphatase